MWIVRIALGRPYTFIVLGLLILILAHFKAVSAGETAIRFYLFRPMPCCSARKVLGLRSFRTGTRSSHRLRSAAISDHLWKS